MPISPRYYTLCLCLFHLDTRHTHFPRVAFYIILSLSLSPAHTHTHTHTVPVSVSVSVCITLGFCQRSSPPSSGPDPSLQIPKTAMYTREQSPARKKNAKKSKVIQNVSTCLKREIVSTCRCMWIMAGLTYKDT